MLKHVTLLRSMTMTSLLLLLIFALVSSGCAPAATPEPEEMKLKVAGVIFGPVSDEGFAMSHHMGLQQMDEALPNVEYVYADNVPRSEEVSQTVEQFILDGANVIITSTAFGDFIYNVAVDHPEVKFLELGGTYETDNMITFYVEHWDPSYLIGMAAGLMTETNKLGYVGAFPMPVIYASVNAFHLGAQSVNPDVTTSVVLINNFYDPPAARQAGEALFDDGVDVVFNIMNEPSLLQLAEERGTWAGMWNVDMRSFGPNAYISSVELDWSSFYIAEMQAILDGTWEGNRVVLLPIGEGVDRDDWGQNIPQEVRDQIDAIRSQMLEGLNVFVGPIYDANGELKVAEGEELTDDFLYEGWTWAVEGVTGLP